MLARIPFAHKRKFVTKYEGQRWLALRIWGEWCWLTLPGYEEQKHANA